MRHLAKKREYKLWQKVVKIRKNLETIFLDVLFCKLSFNVIKKGSTLVCNKETRKTKKFGKLGEKLTNK